MHAPKLRSKNPDLFEIGFFSILFLFSALLMWKTFRVNAAGNMELASRVWSDFAATLPLVRSFSYGDNFPPEYPIFSGEPIRYHFLFFAAVGTLEKAGLGIDHSLNGLSVVSFFLLCTAVYYLGKTLSKNKKVGVLSVLLFIFNGSLGFLEFFKKNPVSIKTPVDILNNSDFSSFGPYDGKIVSAFWNLNIYTNQRHLAFAYAAFIFLTIIIYRFSKSPDRLSWTKTLLFGVFLGFFPFLHIAVFAMLGIALGVFFLLYPKLRLKLFAIGFLALILSVPQFIYMGKGASEVKLFDPGYLVEVKTFAGYLSYWLMNLGLTSVLAPIGFFLANKTQRKLFIPFLALFIIGNTFQFSPEVAANHKFFNLFVIGANLFTALFLIKLWDKNISGKVISILLLFPLTLTGIIDLFPILNDNRIELKDYPNDATISFIVENTPKDSVFLNSQFLYHPASVAGRKIFMGWPYFSWSAGYDTHQRGNELDTMFLSNDKNKICQLLEKNKIDYVTVQDTSGDRDFPKIDIPYFDQNFVQVYKNGEFRIYEVSLSCRL